MNNSKNSVTIFFSKKLLKNWNVHRFDLLYPNSMKFWSQIATASINPCCSLKLLIRWYILTYCKKLPLIFKVSQKNWLKVSRNVFGWYWLFKGFCNHEVPRWPNFGLLSAHFLTFDEIKTTWFTLGLRIGKDPTC